MLACGAASAASRICISNDTLIFGQRALGSSTLSSSTVTSCGTTAFTFGNVVAHPASDSQFRVDTTCVSGTAMPPGSSCTLDVHFEPVRTGQVSGGYWFHNDTSTPDQIVTYYGRGVDAQAGTASIAFSPSVLDFGATELGTEAGPLEMILQNVGTSTLVPSALVLNGPTAYDYRAQAYGDGNDCGVGIGVAPGATCHLKFYFRPQASGARDANLVVDAPQLATLAILQVTGNSVVTGAANIDVIEFQHPSDGQYFITADPAEIAFLDGGGLGADWTRTGAKFHAWPRDDTSSTSEVDVCRFFGTPGVGPNSHFFTGNATECALVKTDPHWIYEGIAFRSVLPQNGQCPTGYTTVNRLWLPGADVTGSRHRYTADAATIATMTAAGWKLEGPVFCAP
jgi:hypothetical protein